jgi:polysaccharide pyruvyl transferase CsaB
MSHKPIRAAVLGYYGFGNLGDEAVLAGIRQALAGYFTPELLVLTHSPEQTVRMHPGVQTVNRWQWKDVDRALQGVEVFILGGGSLLQDATSVKSVLWYTLMALIARRRARYVAWWGQGIGPLNSALARAGVRFIGNQADLITVRDEKSAALLKEIGIRRSITTVADPAFALDVPPTSHTSAAVWFALRRWKEDRVGAALKEDGLQLSQANPGNVIALPMHQPEDSIYMQTLLPGMPQLDWQNKPNGLEEALGGIGQARLVVSMRLHALIFAARCGVPFVALSYDPKVDALAESAGQQDCLLALDNLTAEQIAEKMRQVLETATMRRKDLLEFSRQQRERALAPARLLAMR